MRRQSGLWLSLQYAVNGCESAPMPAPAAGRARRHCKVVTPCGPGAARPAGERSSRPPMQRTAPNTPASRRQADHEGRLRTSARPRPEAARNGKRLSGIRAWARHGLVRTIANERWCSETSETNEQSVFDSSTSEHYPSKRFRGGASASHAPIDDLTSGRTRMSDLRASRAEHAWTGL